METLNLSDEFNSQDEIAIIGMAGRFPGANSIDGFWKNLKKGVESISFFSDEELLSAGIDSEVLKDPNYVRAGTVLENVELFDASFFGFSPKEAAVMDPQHRLFMETVWEVLESTGYNPETYIGRIGLFAGKSVSNYLFSNLYPHSDLLREFDTFQIFIGNDKDHLTTHISYKLNLTGPSINVQTTCSTSLVSVHLACRSLLDGESDIALAGGVSINIPQKRGYQYQSGNILSLDGHCRAFDAQAQGTVFGNGLGVVALKRLEDAIADGDCIHAVIKASAVNNDGALKVGYTAPSVDGQREVILEALSLAGIDPETISYIETHGTGTQLGDPIEIKALSQAFKTDSKSLKKCALGSVKTNVGHLNTAAGVTGLIKTVMALKYQLIPPSLNFEHPNPEIDFDNSPFCVNTTLSEWTSNGNPRRASVSSFGIGGTNAHVILEEAPVIPPSGASRPHQLLLLSAKTSTALDAATANLATYLNENPDISLPDIAYTLSVGRKSFEHRRFLVCCDRDEAITLLNHYESQQVLTAHYKPHHCPVIFMFSGQGSQYVNMGRELYAVEPTFRNHVNTCAEILLPHLGLDIRSLLYPDEPTVEVAASQLQQTAFAQPALFIVEYALAQLLKEWGVQPEAMIGHSIGEYVAATLAGVFDLDIALAIVAKRGQMMQQLPSGSMLAIPLPESEVQPLIAATSTEVAAINSPSSCVVSGCSTDIAALQQQLASRSIECRQLHTSHAFHSVMMEPILEPFMSIVQQVQRQAPTIPFVSNVTGTWITKEQATDPTYWAQHLRQTVQFSQGIGHLLEEFDGVFLEVGPGRTLSTLTTQHLKGKNLKWPILTSLRHVREQQSDVRFLLQILGRLWFAGVEVNWSGFYRYERRHRLPLPTYPFERQRYWINPPKSGENSSTLSVSLGKNPDIDDWFYLPFWKPSLPPIQLNGQALESVSSWTLVFIDECGLGNQLVKRLATQNNHLITVKVGEKFASLGETQYTINPENPQDYEILINELFAHNQLPQIIVHLWNVTPITQQELTIAEADKAQKIGFYSLLFLAQAIGKQETTDEFSITVISNNLQPVTGTEKLRPEKAPLIGPIKVIPQEYSHLRCRSIDITLPPSGSLQEEKLVNHLLAELKASEAEQLIAYRGWHRWVQTFEPVCLGPAKVGKPRLRDRGVYLITGGLGGIGLVLAEYLAICVQARLLLVGRSVLPKPEEWEQWLATHDETDSTSRKIRKVQELERLGAEVLVVSADVSNLEQMQRAIAQAQGLWGQLNGVIHAAGVPGGGVIQRKTQTEVERMLAAKIKGTLVLDALVKNLPLDFFVLTSSMSSISGGFGQVDYCGANAFLDAFAHSHSSRESTLITSINWDTWQEVGMAVNTEIPQHLQELRTEKLEQGILPHEGVEAFSRALEGTIPQVVVSTADLFSSLKQSNASTERPFLEHLDTTKPFNSKYPRPELSHDYVAPRNEVERKLVEIWQEVLGIEQIGIYDNFFEIGGDSIIGIQLIAALNKAFDLNLSVARLYECPNIDTMADIFTSGEFQEITFEQRLSRGKRRRQIKCKTAKNQG